MSYSEVTPIRRPHKNTNKQAKPYLSPEQIKGDVLTPQSDLFSLGVVLYEMLTGVHPFKKSLGMDTAYAILHDTPSLISARPEAVAPELQRLLDTTLAKRPHERSSVHEIRSHLARLIQQGAAEPPPLTRTLLVRLRHALGARYVALPGLLVIAGAVYFGHQRVEHNRKVGWARDVALPEISRLTDAGKVLVQRHAPNAEAVRLHRQERPGSDLSGVRGHVRTP